MIPNKPPRLTLPIDQAPDGPKREQRRCEAKGCNAPTKEGKSHCAAHILCMPYAKKVMEELKRLPPEEDWRPQEIKCAHCGAKCVSRIPRQRYCSKQCGQARRGMHRPPREKRRRAS